MRSRLLLALLCLGCTAFDSGKYLEYNKDGKDVQTIEKVDGQFILTKKVFNPDTGEELAAEVSAVRIETLQEEQAALEKRLADVKAVIKELQQLP